MSQFRILCVDGGGIRGLLTTVWLEKLEDYLTELTNSDERVPLSRFFDLFAGTSTGSIICCGLILGKSVSEIRTLYYDNAVKIFPPDSSWFTTPGWHRPKYTGAALEHILQVEFSNQTLGDIPKNKYIVIPTYDTISRTARILKNTKLEHLDLEIWRVCRSSTAAPFYFPAHPIKIDNIPYCLIDGGMVANNPTACAIAESIKIGRTLGDLVVASFGTGENTKEITETEATTWGITDWAFNIIDVLFDGACDAVHYQAKQLLRRDQYYRFQTALPDERSELDKSDTENLDGLLAQANRYLEEGDGDEKLKQLAEKLIDGGGSHR